jgi:hypothetical protein
MKKILINRKVCFYQGITVVSVFGFLVSLFFLLEFVFVSFCFCFCCLFCLFRYTLWVMILGFHSNFPLHLSVLSISSVYFATHRPLMGLFLPPTVMSFLRPLPISVSDELVIGSSFRLLSFAWCASCLFPCNLG